MILLVCTMTGESVTVTLSDTCKVPNNYFNRVMDRQNQQAYAKAELCLRDWPAAIP